MRSIIAIIAVTLTIAAVNGSAYGPAGLVGPPCPKSVVVSCAPLVQSVPCKPGAPKLGAYSEQYPQYITPAEESKDELASAASEYAPKYLAPRYSPYYKYY